MTRHGADRGGRPAQASAGSEGKMTPMTSVTVERDGAVASVILPGPALSLAVKEGLLESLLTVAADD